MTPDDDKTPKGPSANPEPEKRPPAHPEHKEHEGATEDEVAPTTPPRGPGYEDEPKQG